MQDFNRTKNFMFIFFLLILPLAFNFSMAGDSKNKIVKEEKSEASREANLDDGIDNIENSDAKSDLEKAEVVKEDKSKKKKISKNKTPAKRTTSSDSSEEVKADNDQVDYDVIEE